MELGWLEMWQQIHPELASGLREELKQRTSSTESLHLYLLTGSYVSVRWLGPCPPRLAQDFPQITCVSRHHSVGLTEAKGHFTF